MSKFYELTVSRINRETPDTVSIEFLIPEAVRSIFQYKQGQYLTFKINKDGQEYRRSYSICSSPYNGEGLKVAVKEVNNGIFSTFANRELKEGNVLQTMPPMGNFFTELKADQQKKYVAFAAGSGITPVLSIIKSVLLVEKGSEFQLFYGNKDENSIIFKNEIETLASNYPNFKFTYIFSRQKAADNHQEGRIDRAKAEELLKKNNLENASEYFVCGPEDMIHAVTGLLADKKVDKKKVHFELFTTPVAKPADSTSTESFSGMSKVTAIMDGNETAFDLSGKGISILDAAIDAGLDAPFSCKGAVCCTCKAKVLEGKVKMDMNYALSDEEVAEGYILTCQSHPLTAEVKVDFDV